jgi:hypothetical protein
MEYRMYDPETGQLRTDGGISTREYVRRVRGMSVEDFERRYGAPVSEVRSDDDEDYSRRLIVLKRMDNV